MSKFLPTATNFQDLEPQAKPSEKYSDMAGPWVLCPKCKGYGGWILTLNAYPSHEPPDCHFRASCFHCNGWGWVEADGPDVHCIHDFKEISAEEARNKGKEHWGMCWHVVECTKCGRLRSYDSSD